MLTQFHGIGVKCAYCTMRDRIGNVRPSFLWENQYGKKIRLYCSVCGQVEDITTLKYGLTKREVVFQGTEDYDEIPF